MEKFKERIIDLYEEYAYDRVSEGGWSGHEFAAVYQADFRKKLTDFFNDFRAQFGYSNGQFFKNGELCNRATEKEAWQNANLGTVYLRDDYEVLINQVYSSNDFQQQDHAVIADALDAAFRNKLECAIQSLENIAKAYGVELENHA